jgi:hypothetical protein
LWNQLAIDALQLRIRRGWPAQVRSVAGEPKFYLEEICALVLDDDMHLPLFRAAPILYAHYMGVTMHTWEQSLAVRFDALRRCYAGWVLTAENIINARLADAAADDSTPVISPKVCARVVTIRRA